MPLLVTDLHHVDHKLTVRRKGESSTIVETYRLEVNDDATLPEIELVTYSAGSAQALNVPIMRVRHLDDSRFVCTEKTFTQIDHRVWHLEAIFSTKLYTNAYPSDEDGNYGARPHWTMSRRCGLKMIDRYVNATTYPANGDAVWPPTSVISGVKVDRFGQPLRVPSPVHEIFLSTQVDRAYGKSLGAWDPVHLFGVNPYLGYRNEVDFLGYPAGSVVLTGFDDQPTDDPWQSITIRMTASDEFHLEQIWLPGADGRQLLSTVTTYASKTIKQLDAAFWYQPYPDKYDFYNFDIWGNNFQEIVDPSPVW
jgi:hypothetical protein